MWRKPSTDLNWKLIADVKDENGKVVSSQSCLPEISSCGLIINGLKPGKYTIDVCLNMDGYQKQIKEKKYLTVLK